MLAIHLLPANRKRLQRPVDHAQPVPRASLLHSRYWRKTRYRDAICYYCVSPACRELAFETCHAFAIRNRIYIRYKRHLTNMDLMEHEYQHVL